MSIKERKGIQGLILPLKRSPLDRTKHALKLRTKALIALILLIAMIVVTSAISAYTLMQTDQRFAQFVNGEVQLYSRLLELHNLALARGVAVRDLSLISGDSIAKINFEQAMNRTLDTLQQIEPLARQYGLTEQFAEIERLTMDDLKLQQEVIQLIEENHVQYAMTTISVKETPVMRNIEEKLVLLKQQQLQTFNQKSAAINQMIQASIRWLYAVVVVFILFSAAIYVTFRRHVLSPVQLIVKLVKRMADKDLTASPLPVKRQDEIGEVSDHINVMTDNLKYVIREIQQTSAKLASTSLDLSGHTEEMSNFSNSVASNVLEVAGSVNHQMGSIEENRRSIDELVAAAQQIAATTADVHSVSQHAMELAHKGHHSLEHFMKQMETIHDSSNHSVEVIGHLLKHSQEIDKVNGVISTITKRTNILSLNASIEAARAGEAGKGFAVVANEVRELAKQSEEYAKQISNLIRLVQSDTRLATESINKGQHEVEEGRKLIRQMNDAIQQIVQSIQLVSNQIQEVSGATEQISASSVDIAASVEDIEAMAKQSAQQSQHMADSSREHLSSVKKVAASANSLYAVAHSLDDMLKQFTVVDHTA